MLLSEAKDIILKEFVTKTGSLSSNPAIVHKFNSLKTTFVELLQCDNGLTIATILYCIINDIQPKTCLHCGKQLNVYRFSSGYNGKGSTYCSQKCSSVHKHDKTTNSIFTDYESLLDINGIPDSQKIDKHLNNISVEKLKQITGISASVRTMLYAALRGTTKLRYCKECGNVIDIVRFSADPYPTTKQFCSQECRNKNKEFKNNLRDNNLERMKTAEYIETVGIPWFESKINSILKSQNVTTLATYDEIKSSPRQSSYFKFKCNVCNFEFDARFIGAPICKKCNPNSKPQLALAEFIESLGFEIKFNDRTLIKPYELDIVIPNLKIAIEYDGLYWHQNRDHYHKYLKCLDIGYRLIKIFDDEPEEIFKSRIAAILGVTETKIHGRKCSINEIDHNIYKEFMEHNHIQGYTAASKVYGLSYNNELVSVMSFGKSRFKSGTEWELMRFANKLNTSVIGGASKLFNKFVADCSPNSVLSYCDLRWGTGKVYENMGFKLSHKTQQGYWWYKNKRESRIKYQKHKLAALFPTADMSKSESEIMMDNGYSKIYDFGNSVYIWNDH